MQKGNRICWKYQLFIFVVWVSGSWSNANHMGNSSQKNDAKISMNQLNAEMKQTNTGSNQGTNENILKTETMPVRPQKSKSQLQLEIQELLRMQKQLKAEIVSGAETSKRSKLLQHIKTQIHLRRLQLKNKVQLKPDVSSNTHVEVSQPNQIQTNLQNSAHAMHQQQTLKNVSNTMEKKQSHQINLTQRQQQPENAQYSSQVESNQLNSLNQVSKSNIVPKVINYQNTELITNNLNQQQQYQQQEQQLRQQQFQMQPISNAAFIQQMNPFILSDPTGLDQAQINMMQQQQRTMNQNVLQVASPQHILVPINALSLNSMVPRNVLTGERFIVLDSSIQDTGQIRTVEEPKVVKSVMAKSTLKATTTPPTTTTPQAQQITKTTTPLPKTTQASTVVTTPSPTPAPSKPTPKSFAYGLMPVNTNMFRQAFFQGEIQRQQLEITKLKLEIRDLQRKEMGGMSKGESENDDAPPRRMRFSRRRMQFPFF